MTDNKATLKQLFTKKRVYTIGKHLSYGEQHEVEIETLSIDDLGLMEIDKDSSMSEQTKQMRLLTAKSLGIEIEEAGKISIEFLFDLMDVIMEANNFGEGGDSKIKKLMKEKKESIEKKQ